MVEERKPPFSMPPIGDQSPIPVHECARKYFALKRALQEIPLHIPDSGKPALAAIIEREQLTGEDGEPLSADQCFSREGVAFLYKQIRDRYIPTSPSVEAHAAHLRSCITRLEEVLRQINPSFSVGLLGSLTTGRAPSLSTDLDLIFCLPTAMTDTTELEAVLSSVNFCGIDEEGTIGDVQRLLERGTGYSRLFGLLGDDLGIEQVEILLLGEKDLRSMSNLHPGNVSRVRPSTDKTEVYVDLQEPHTRVPFIKPGRFIPHYFRHSDGGAHLGFFPTVLLSAKPLYDPSGLLAESQSRIWSAAEKSYLYHNGGLEKDGQYWKVRDDVMNREPGALAYLWYQDIDNYSPEEAQRISILNAQAKEAFGTKPWLHGSIPDWTLEQGCKEANETGGKKLVEVFQNGVYLVVSDIDNTLLGHAIDKRRMLKLIQRAQQSHLPIALNTGRGASAQIEFDRTLRDIAINSPVPVYIATNNGASVCWYTPATGEKVSIVDRVLSDDERDAIIGLYNSFDFNFSDQEYAPMGRSLQAHWAGIVPDNFIEMAKRNRGMWIERGKISVMVPDTSSAQQLIIEIAQRWGNHFYCASNSNRPIVDISLAGPEGKMNAVMQFADMCATSLDHVVVFGDSPSGNDREMLEGCPYSFTDEVSSMSSNPPFRLPGTGNFVYRTHKAINAFTRNR